MITMPAGWLDAANRTHAPRWRVWMVDQAGAEIGQPMPIVGGRISKTWALTPRTRASIEVPTQMLPALIDQSMIPTGQGIRIEYNIAHYTDWVIIADLDLVSSRISRPGSWRLEAADRSIRVALDDTARGGWVEPTGTISAAIQYIVKRTFPSTVFTVTGPATTQTVPAGTKTDGDPWAAAVGLATAAQSEVFFRPTDKGLVFVRPLPTVSGAPVDAVGVGPAGQVTQYDLTHEMAYNAVALTYQDKSGGTVLRVGRWTDTRTTSPVAVQRIKSHVVYRETRKADAAPSQAEADAAAAVVGRRVAGRTRSPSIRHVCRPWLEPGDVVDVTYAGGPTERQQVDSVDIPLDNTNIQTTTLRSDAYQMGTPV